MRTHEMRKALEHALSQQGWKTTWNKDEEKINVHLQEQEDPVHISVPQLLKRIKDENRAAESVIEEAVHQINIVNQTMQDRRHLQLTEEETQIFPVMRSRSFPTEDNQGNALVYEEHTAESRIYFAVDRGKSYILLDQDSMNQAGWSHQQLKEKALFNLRRLDHEIKRDEVAGSTFYFISPQDGYAASRILNQSLLKDFAQKVIGDFCVSIPHQDVLILADVKDDTGYDVLGQMSMHFYRNGDMPITPLPFAYKEGELEPIFILARKKPKK